MREVQRERGRFLMILSRVCVGEVRAVVWYPFEDSMSPRKGHNSLIMSPSAYSLSALSLYF